MPPRLPRDDALGWQQPRATGERDPCSARDVEYVYFCDNETVDGTEFKGLPAVDDNDAFVSDMSSNFMSRPVDWTRYAAVWAAQKNFGTAGLACVIVRRDQACCAAETVPQMLDWSVYARNNSLQNTPPVLQFYTAMPMARWVDEQGGVAEMDRRAKERSALLYDTIDSMGDFYVSRIAPEARSRMNVVFSRARRRDAPARLREGGRGAGPDESRRPPLRGRPARVALQRDAHTGWRARTVYRGG